MIDLDLIFGKIDVKWFDVATELKTTLFEKKLIILG
jgi:hypothetical protein